MTRWVAAVLFVFGVWTSTASAQVDASARLDRLLIKEAPPGWAPTAREAAAPAEFGEVGVGRTQVFEMDDAHVFVTLWDPTVDPSGSTELAFALKTRAARRAAPFAAPAGGIGWSVEEVLDGATWHTHGVAVRHGGLIVQAEHVAPDPSSDADVSALLGAFLDRQLAQPTVPAVTPEVPDDAQYLYEKLLNSPGEGYVLLPGASGLVTSEQLLRLGKDEAFVRMREAVQGFSRDVARSWVIPEVGPELRVVLTDTASPRAADAMLRGAAGKGRLDPTSGTVTQEHDGSLVLIARHGQYVISVGVTGEQPLEERRALAQRTLDAQRRQLGDDPSGASEDAGASHLIGGVFGTFALLAALRLTARRWKRRNLRIDDPSAEHSVAPTARRLRRTGFAMGVVLALFASTAIATWPLNLPVALVSAALVPLTVLVRRRAERRGVRLGLRRPRLIRSALIATASLLVLAVTALLALTAAWNSTYGPSLQDSDFQRESGIDLGALGGMAALILPLMVVFLFRLARRQAGLRADELRALDPRPQVLYLRGFQDDKLRIPTIVSGRRPIVELLSPVPTERYEEVVAWKLGALGPVVAIAPPGSGLSSLGAARELVPLDEDWQDFVADEIDRSSTIVISLATSEGALWELAHVAERGLLERVLILFPPLDADELRSRWATAADTLQREGVDAALPIDPATALVAIYEHGHFAGFSADVRDEAGYRVAIDAAAERLAMAQGLAYV